MQVVYVGTCYYGTARVSITKCTAILHVQIYIDTIR